jgi:hypothetical protein
MMMLKHKSMAPLSTVKPGSESVKVTESHDQGDKECEDASVEKVEKGRTGYTTK